MLIVKGNRSHNTAAFTTPYNFCQKKCCHSILITCVIVITLISNLLSYGEWWTNAVFCFPLGVVWGAKEGEMTNFLFKRYRVTIGAVAVLFSLFFYIDEVFYHPIIRSLSVLFFVVLIIICSYKVTFKSPIFHC